MQWLSLSMVDFKPNYYIWHLHVMGTEFEDVFWVVTSSFGIWVCYNSTQFYCRRNKIEICLNLCSFVLVWSIFNIIIRHTYYDGRIYFMDWLYIFFIAEEQNYCSIKLRSIMSSFQIRRNHVSCKSFLSGVCEL